MWPHGYVVTQDGQGEMRLVGSVRITWKRSDRKSGKKWPHVRQVALLYGPNLHAQQLEYACQCCYLCLEANGTWTRHRCALDRGIVLLLPFFSLSPLRHPKQFTYLNGNVRGGISNRAGGLHARRKYV